MAAETVTVVFTDLVGSTELLVRVGEAKADEVRRAHFRALRDVISDHGGHVVKNLGDGLMIVFHSVTSALAAAVAMQQVVSGRRAANEFVAIRVGIAAGEAEAEDGDYFGLPVVEAARLCAKASAAEILTTAIVHLLARSRTAVEMESIGVSELKGLDEPVETYRVRWVPLDPAELRPPLPARLLSARSTNFVGRDEPRESLREFWKTVATGNRQLIVVGGEPGIGKTALAAEFAAEVVDQGALVAYGRSDEDLGLPYQPWIEALTQCVNSAPRSVLEEHVADRGAHLARLVPQLADRLGIEAPAGGTADAERFVLYACVGDLLARLSEEQPVLLVFDDLHWADRATAHLVRHVATSDTSMAVGIIATFRTSELDASAPVTELFAALHREGAAERIVLEGLGDEDVLTFLEGVAGQRMDDKGVALRDALLLETGGNPFFVGEILRHLAESGAIEVRADGRWRARTDLRDAGLPVSVREVIGRRVAALGPDPERVLAFASVIGRDFDVALLAAATHTDEDDVIDRCDRAVAAAVLQTTDILDRYTFSHALIEHTLYDTLSPSRRARAHRAVAEALEDRVGDDPAERVSELAYHWAAAAHLADPSKAIHYASAAGRRALEYLAPDEALRWYTRALELLGNGDDDRRHAEILVGLGEAQRQSGIGAHRETLLEAARVADAAGEIELVVRAVLANNRGHTSGAGDVDPERLAAVDRALELVGDAASAERAKLLSLAAIERVNTVELAERVALAERGVAVARTSGDLDALAFALQRPFDAIAHPSTLALRSAWADEAVAIARDRDDLAMRYLSHFVASLASVERGDGVAVDHHLLRARETAARLPDTHIRASLMQHEAWLTGLRGDLVGFEQQAEAALAYGIEHGEADAMTVYAVQIVNVRIHQGRIHELIPVVEGALGATPALRALRGVLALAKTRAGELDEGKRMLDEELAAGLPLWSDFTWSSGMSCWVETAFHVGAIEAAPVLREQILPYHNQIVCALISFQPSLAHYLGLLDHLAGNHDSADAWFAAALALHENVRSPILVAETQAAWAMLLRDRESAADHERARQMAETAHGAATANGYGYVEADTRRILGKQLD